VISRIIEVEVGVINLVLQLQLMTLNVTLIILDITEKLNLHVIVVLLYIEGKKMEIMFLLLR